MTLTLSTKTLLFYLGIVFGTLLSINDVSAQVPADASGSNINSNEPDQNTSSKSKTKTTQEINEQPLLSFLDGSYNYISSNVESLARNLDEYFSSDKIEYEKSGTVLRLREDIIWSESAGLRLKGDLRLKLQLPHTQKKMRLVFQSRAKERNFAGEDDSSFVGIEKQEEEYSAELQASIEGKSGWKFKPSIGAYLETTIDTYVKFRLNHQKLFGRWSTNLDGIPYWVDSIGWAFDSYFDLSRKIGEHDLFRASSFAGWRRDIDYFQLSQFFSMNHQLNTESAISYFTGIYGISEPKVHTTQYLLGITYRRNLYKNYLFLEVKPEVKYRIFNRFKPEHSLILRFEMLFAK